MANAAAHNGKRLQTNPYFLQYGGAFPFMNWIKTASDLFRASGSGPVTPDLLDSDGYPNTSVGIGILCFGPDPLFARPGNRVLKWTGSGTPNISNFNSTLQPGTGGKQSSATPIAGVGRYEFSTTSVRFDIRIDQNIRNLVLCHIDDEDRLDAGEIFNRDWLAVQASFGFQRWLDWQYGNTSNVTTWATRKPVNYLFYHGDERRASIYAQTAATRSETAFSCTGPAGFAIADKATVTLLFQDGYTANFCTFTNGSATISVPSGHGLTSASIGKPCYIGGEGNGGSSSTFPVNFASGTRYYIKTVPDGFNVTVAATAGGSDIVAGAGAAGNFSFNPVITLNISGTGDVEVIDKYCFQMQKGLNNYPIGSTSQSLATVVYDAALGKFIKYGGCADDGSMGLQNGVPPEIMVRACAEAGQHPHFVTPFLAADPATDYMPSLAYYIRTSGPAWMKPRFEGPNELWNTAGGFFQTHYANRKATAYTWGNDFHNWYGKVMSVLGQLIAGAYGVTQANVKTQNLYEVVLAIQTSQAGDTTGLAPRFTSAKYIGTTPQSSVSGSWGTTNISATSGVAEAWRWATTGAVANYVAPSDKDQAAETTKATAFNGVFFGGSVSGDVLTVTQQINSVAIPAGLIIQGQGAAGGAFSANTVIQAYGTAGTTGNGGLGTYKLSKPALTAATGAFYMWGCLDFSQADAYVATLGGGASGANLAQVKVWYGLAKTLFSNYSINLLIGYEGGYSPDLSGAVTTSVNNLRALSKYSAGLFAYMRTNYDNFKQLEDGTFRVDGFSFYVTSGPIDGGKISLAWSVLDDLYQNPRPAIWNAIQDINARGQRLRLTN